MKTTKVSVVVPVYNAEKSLETCLDSILAQNHDNLEVLLVNDGSRDGSLGICRAYQERFPEKVQVYDQPNSGPAAARNKGIVHSSGEYIAFVDADDTILPNMISAMLTKAEENDADMVVCSYYQQRNGKTTAVSYRYPEGLYEGTQAEALALALIDETGETDLPPYSWVRLTKRQLFVDTGVRFIAGLVRSEDFHFWTKVHFLCQRVYLLSNSQLYRYVENTASITHRYIPDYWNGVLCIYNDLHLALPETVEIRRRLGIMLLRRSLIALNNACRCDNAKLAYQDMKQIIGDATLNAVIRVLQPEDMKRYQMYPILMKYGGKKLIIAKYMLRNFRNRCSH